MHLAFSALYGPGIEDLQSAGSSMREFLCTVQANWNSMSRRQAPAFDTGQQCFAEMLVTVPVSGYQDQLDFLHRYGAPRFGGVTEGNRDKALEELRAALPFHWTFASNPIAFDLEMWQRNTAQVASVNALYLLLLQTEYWQQRLQQVIGTADRQSLYHLGLTMPGRQSVDRRVDYQRDAFKSAVQLLRNEMELRDRPADHHPLEVLARMFDPRFFADQLALDMVELPSDSAPL